MTNLIKTRTPRTIDIDKVFSVSTLIKESMFRYGFHLKNYTDMKYQSAVLKKLDAMQPKSEVFWDEDDFPYTIQADKRHYIV